MNVRTICLAILQLGDATGYEIRRHVAEGRFAHFVDASFGSIYPALNKLEADGLVDAHIVEQDGKPNRRVYAINDTGRAAFAEMLAQPIRPDVFRSEFMLLAMFAQYLHRDDLRAAIDLQVRHILAELETIDEAEAAIDLDAAAWIAGMGRDCLNCQLEYIYENRERLEDMARGEPLTGTPPLVAAE